MVVLDRPNIIELSVWCCLDTKWRPLRDHCKEGSQGTVSSEISWFRSVTAFFFMNSTDHVIGGRFGQYSFGERSPPPIWFISLLHESKRFLLSRRNILCCKLREDTDAVIYALHVWT